MNFADHKVLDLFIPEI